MLIFFINPAPSLRIREGVLGSKTLMIFLREAIMKNERLFKNFKEEKLSESIISQCAELYCEVWKEEPWNEYFWTVEDVCRKIEADIGKAGSEFFVSFETAGKNMSVTGFSWGFSLGYEQINKISERPEFLKHFSLSGNVFYIAELGVDIKFRRCGTGKILSKTLIKKVIDNGFDCIILRTDVKANEARALYIKLGFRELPVYDPEFTDRTYWIMTL